MTGPLAGVRIIELPALGPVPFAGMLLADLGAEVIRIDKPAGAKRGVGDAMAAGPIGRGRRSIALDLRTPHAAEVVLRLAESADAFIEGSRPGVAERLGVGPAPLLARNPGLVYGRMTGWGQHGPLSATAGHDITYLALTGLLHGIGAADAPPVPPINYVADFGGGAMFLLTGLLAALLHARTTGVGQVIDAAMTDGAAYLGTMTRVLAADGSWADERGSNTLDGGAPNYRCYECADGRYLAVGALEPQFWAALVSGLGADVDDAPSPYNRSEWAACQAWLAGRLKSRSRDDWAEIFSGSDACVAPVLTLAEAPRHPHNVARGTYSPLGSAVLPVPAPRFSVTVAQLAPMTTINAATDDLLRELGFDTEDIETLRAEKALG